MLGLNGGVNGTGFSGPAQASIANPVTQGQIGSAYTGNQDALGQQQALLQALQGQNGIQNQSNVFNQLQGVANGTGPNPAQAMLNQATGANVANQAALMAGQRGANANAGLIARQAAQQGANTQQQAAGQGATMQANQQLGALNQLGGLAGQQAGQQIGATQANTAAQQAEQGQLLGAQQGFNQAQVSNQASVNAANAGLAGQTMGGQQGLIGGGLNALGGAFGMTGAKKAEGGMITQPTVPQTPQGPQSSFAKALISRQTPSMTSNAAPMAQGGRVPALVSPGEKYLPPEKVEAVKQGANPMKIGETIPGTPKVKGAKNSYANDTIPKTLEEGGIVLPRSVTQAKNPEWAAHAFVRATLKKDLK